MQARHAKTFDLQHESLIRGFAPRTFADASRSRLLAYVFDVHNAERGAGPPSPTRPTEDSGGVSSQSGG